MSNIRLYGECFSASGFDSSNSVQGSRLVLKEIDGHCGATFCQSQCNTAPDSSRGAGDQGEFSVKLFRVDRHPVIPFSSGLRCHFYLP
jgi:hypothetical protein